MSTVLANAIVSSDQDAVICQVPIAASPGNVFQALTSSDRLMRGWNGEDGPCRVTVWEIEPRIGHS